MNIQRLLNGYIDFCGHNKKLSKLTLKAYRIDLTQFSNFSGGVISKTSIDNYIKEVVSKYKNKSAKRKIAALKAFIKYLFQEGVIKDNPFYKINYKLKDYYVLPKIVPLNEIDLILKTMYCHLHNNVNGCCNKEVTRDIAIVELLFATGARVSEVCNLKKKDIDLVNHTMRIYGKGGKERLIQIENIDVLMALEKYCLLFEKELLNNEYFFINRLNHHISDQSVRNMIYKYVKMASINRHITPHMFRHSFATLLLEENVDIRYIQKLLGHSSITTTQIYTYVALNKQKEILLTKHPRNKIIIEK